MSNNIISIRQGGDIIIAYLGGDDNLSLKVCKGNEAYAYLHDDLPPVRITPRIGTCLGDIVHTMIDILHLEYEQEAMIASFSSVGHGTCATVPDGWVRYDPPIIDMGDISEDMVRQPTYVMGEALLTRRMVFSGYRDEGRPLINVSLTITFGGDERFPLVSASTTIGNRGELDTFLLDNLPLEAVGDDSYGIYFPDEEGQPHGI